MNSEDTPLEILLVEDCANDAIIFKAFLEDIPISVGRCVSVTTLAKGIEVVESDCQPDLVFLDLSLPDAWGLEGLAQLLRHNPALIIIVLTGSEDLNLPLKALQMGAHDYILKHELSPSMLARVMRFALYREQTQSVNESALVEAQRANESKSHFLACIGHELRTPLNIIMGYTNLFQSQMRNYPEVDAKEIMEDLETVKDAEEHLHQMLNELLDMAKIEAGQMRLEPHNFCLNHVVENINELFRSTFIDRNNSFEYEIRGEVPEVLYGDPKRIRQILINLLSNANKFTENGQIQLLVECRPTELLGDGFFELSLQVIDTGIGIAPIDQARIFEFFQQADGSDQRKYAGTGIGLTICRQLTEMMGGEITVQSEKGKGSTFTATLAIATPQAEADPDQPDDAFAKVRGRRALVVEDEVGARNFVRRVLEQMGLEVKTAANSEEAAMLLFSGKQFDFAVLDVHMPGQNGVELLRAIREHGRGKVAPRVIMATGDYSKIVQDYCTEEGIGEVLHKPFAPQELCKRVLDMA